jgi:hypothetical protein
MSWSFAALQIVTETLMDSIAAESINKMSEFDAQALTNTAWSYAKVSNIPSPILNSLAGEALKKI